MLTNKAYIGVRIINRRSKEEREEVPAAWKPIIETKLFEQVQKVMRENNERIEQ
jgi:hypothetical protein